MDLFESNYSALQPQHRDFDDVSRQFLECMSILTPRAWSFLSQGCKLLENVRDPVDFTWLQDVRSSDMVDMSEKLNYHKLPRCVNRVYEVEMGNTEDLRSNLFRLGVHCLLYGGYLSSVCYDCFHPKTRSIRSILYS